MKLAYQLGLKYYNSLVLWLQYRGVSKKVFLCPVQK